MFRRRPRATLFPYTTLFRSGPGHSPAHPAGIAGVARRTIAAVSTPAGSVPKARPQPGKDAPSSASRDAVNASATRSEEHTSELQSHVNLVCRLLLEKKKLYI